MRAYLIVSARLCSFLSGSFLSGSFLSGSFLSGLLLSGSLLSGCVGYAPPCGCGRSFERDPWTRSEIALGAGHALEDHCLCRCGEGPVVLEDPSSRCDLYEGDCTTADGERARYLCE